MRARILRDLAAGGGLQRSNADAFLKGLPDMDYVWKGLLCVLELKSSDGRLGTLQHKWLRDYAVEAGALSLLVWASANAPSPLYAEYQIVDEQGRLGIKTQAEPGFVVRLLAEKSKKI